MGQQVSNSIHHLLFYKAALLQQVLKVTIIFSFYLHVDHLVVVLGLSSVEAYDPVRNVWECIAPMHTRRSSVGVAVLNGESKELRS